LARLRRLLPYPTRAGTHRSKRSWPMILRTLRLSLLILSTGLPSPTQAQEVPPPVPAEELLPPPTPLAVPALPVPQAVPAPPPQGPACCVPQAEQTHSVHRIKIAEVQEMTTVPRLPIREEIVKVPILATDIEYREEKQTVTVMVAKPRKELREVRSTS